MSFLSGRPLFRCYVKYIFYWKVPGKFVEMFSNFLFQRFNGMCLLFHSPFELAEKAKDMIQGIYTLTMVPSQWMEQKSGDFCTRNLKHPSTDLCFCLLINSNTTYLQTINLKVLIYPDFNSCHEEDKYDDSTFCWSIFYCQAERSQRHRCQLEVSMATMSLLDLKVPPEIRENCHSFEPWEALHLNLMYQFLPHLRWEFRDVGLVSMGNLFRVVVFSWMSHWKLG